MPKCSQHVKAKITQDIEEPLRGGARVSLALPILDCKEPLVPVSKSFSRNTPLPLSLHDCVPLSKTNSLHVSWKRERTFRTQALYFAGSLEQLALQGKSMDAVSELRQCFKKSSSYMIYISVFVQNYIKRDAIVGLCQ